VKSWQRNLRPRGTVLCKREKEVLALLLSGMSNVDIKKYLGMSASTVRTYVHRAMSRLDLVGDNAHYAKGRLLPLVAAALIAGVERGDMQVDLRCRNMFREAIHNVNQKSMEQIQALIGALL
jgi:DNA-binding CsgD family transcriptional regulator